MSLGFSPISGAPLSGLPIFSYTASGGLSLGNSAGQLLSFSYAASGGLSTGNAATSALSFYYTSSGGLRLGNTNAAIQKAKIIQSTSNSTASGTSVTVTWPTLPTAGNLLVAVVGSTTVGSINTPSGWKIAASNTGVNPKSIVFYQENNPARTSVVFSTTGAPATIVVAVAEIANAALSSPLDTGIINSGSTNSAIAFGTTPAQANTSEIGVAGWTNAQAGTNITSVSGTTETWFILPSVTAGSISSGLIIDLGTANLTPQTLTANYTPGGSVNYSTELVFFKPYVFLSTTPSGSLSLGGVADASNSAFQAYTASGGLGLGSSAGVTPTYLYNASSGLGLGNSSVVMPTYVYNASGGLSLSSTVTSQLSFIYNTSGGLSLGSSASVVPTYLYTSSGGLAFSGTAPASQTNNNASFTYTASGSLTLDNTSASQLSFNYQASGGLSLGNSSNVTPTYVYNTSGGLSLGNSVTSQLNFNYQASGGLSLGNSSNVTPTYVYNASGGLSLGGAAGVTTTSIQSYTGSGGLSFSNSASVVVTYLYAASGVLSLASTANANTIFNYLASGKLTFSNSADVTFQPTQLSAVASGGIAFGSAATVKVTYIYQASGLLNLRGSSDGSTPQNNYSYQASGSLTFSGELHRPFDIRQLPFTGYWDLIQDAMAKARETRANCNDPISETAFLGALKNDRVREMISLSTNWHVICYLGNGVYDIQIDGRRMNVDSFLTINQIVIPPFVPPVHIAPAPESELKEFVTVNYLTKDFVLSNLKANSRVKKMLLSPDTKDWVAEMIDGIVAITITTTSNQTVKISVNLEAQAVDTIISSSVPVLNTPSTSKNFATSYADTLPKEAVLTLLGPTSFLRNVPISNWEVLGINGIKVDVKLNNGVIFSVPLR